MNDDQAPPGSPAEEKPAEEKPADAVQQESQAAEPQTQDARRRLRQLLSIPERDRSDEVWDEIISLEITLAPGNRAPSPHGDVGRRQEPGRRQDHRPRQDPAMRQGVPGSKPGKRHPKKSRRGRGGPPGR